MHGCEKKEKSYVNIGGVNVGLHGSLVWIGVRRGGGDDGFRDQGIGIRCNLFA